MPDPRKHPDFQVLQNEPLNGQPPLARVAERAVTPTELFYVRNHAPIPALDAADYRLEVEGMVERPLRLRLPDLQAMFPTVEVTATLQCAGNRRDELVRVAAIPGEVPWGGSALGTAVWRGTPLAEVLRGAGLLDGARHVAFLGLDRVVKGEEAFGFGGSVPLAKALDPDVLLAWEMNGEPLPAEHGHPLRVVVPGYVAARSVKWLCRVRVQLEPSDNYYQQRSYRLFPSSAAPETAEWSQGLMLGELSLTSVICDPVDGQELAAGPVRLRGYAMAGGDRTVERVEVTADHGRSWGTARHEPAPPGVWSLWEAEVELPGGAHELACRAWDSAALTQPEDPAQLWNFKGYMNNAWHRVRVWCAGGDEEDGALEDPRAE
ncbi:MAG TPA: sulfite oxidase [Thermoanaerobaculia bacterium]|nr:sulfite oxidase [Thermoanaerobaculia bacterium]